MKSRRPACPPSPAYTLVEILVAMSIVALAIGAASQLSLTQSVAEDVTQKKSFAVNHAENLAWQIEKTMKEHADKLTDADKQPLQQAVDKTREVAKGTDVAAIKSAVDNLEAASHAFSKVLYEKGTAGAAPTGPEAAGGDGELPQAKPDDDVIEGEFEVKK